MRAGADSIGFSDGGRHLAAIRAWLLAVAALVFAMVLVGGVTRLTESGLSIVEWRPIMGVIPPLTADAWQAEFEKYQAIPQAALNLGMTVADFKTIYWWEWTHRLLGRVVGAAFLLPFLWFLWSGWIAPRLRPRLWFIFALGALQGAVGWWMVASGLADRVEVSQYRLATHLVLACLIFVALVWTAQRLKPRPPVNAPLRWRITAGVLVGLVLLQIYLGALVAGLRAGLIYNTWPLIDGAFIPSADRLMFAAPAWRNLFENTLTVQFDHRMTAYALCIVAALHVIDVARGGRGVALRGALEVTAAILLQAVIGITTLVHQAPLSLALLHQAVAMIVLTAAVMHAGRIVPRAALAQVGAPAAAAG